MSVEDWQKQFSKQVGETLSAGYEVIDSAAAELKARYEERTPVGDPALWNYPAPHGYTPGTLKASWEREDSGSGATKRITISNRQPYAVRVEYGSWSSQAPYGMMRISNLEWSQIVNMAARTNKWFGAS